MKLGIKATVDIVFKKVFGSADHPQVTLSFLNAILKHLDLDPACEAVVENPFLLADFEHGRDVVVDIKATDSHQRQYQIEMQVQEHAGLPERMLYGFARLVSSQMVKGQAWTSLRPTIAIWIIDQPFLPEGLWFEAYRLQGEAVPVPLYGEGIIVVIDLPAWRSQAAPGDLSDPVCWDTMKTELDIWLGVLLASDQLDIDELPPALSVNEFKEAMEIMSVFTYKGHARELYNMRLEAERLRKAEMEFAIQKGLKLGQTQGFAEGKEQGLHEGRMEGRMEGREEGRVEGRLEGREQGLREGMQSGRLAGLDEGAHQAKLETARAMKNEQLPLELIARITGLAPEEIAAL
jgi:predicted transposase/invertase (TIGR01784 family)